MMPLQKRLAEILATSPEVNRDELFHRARQFDPLADSSLATSAVERAWSTAHDLGPLAGLLTERTVTEIMVNGPGLVWVERDQQVEQTTVRLSRNEIDLLIERILDPLGLRVDATSPVVDARMSDGSRVNVVVPPLAVDGPIVTIRRFGTRPVPLSAFGDGEVVALIQELVARRRNVVVAGSTGSGKTTLLNAMAECLPAAERIVTIEDTAELRLPGEHVVRLESRQANAEGVGLFTMRALVKNALRMRPDRLVVGETRGEEALDLLLALTTGHDGALSTIHANDSLGALRRLVALAALSGVDLGPSRLEALVVEAVDAVVFVARTSEGRRVTAVSAVVGELPLRVRPLWSQAPRTIAGRRGKA